MTALCGVDHLRPREYPSPAMGEGFALHIEWGGLPVSSIMNRKKKCKSAAEILRDRLKLEIAGELGLLEKIEADGWGALNSIEAGKIGGLLAGRLKETGRETDPSADT